MKKPEEQDGMSEHEPKPKSDLPTAEAVQRELNSATSIDDFFYSL